jgi:hypothetical protein
MATLSLPQSLCRECCEHGEACLAQNNRRNYVRPADESRTDSVIHPNASMSLQLGTLA